MSKQIDTALKAVRAEYDNGHQEHADLSAYFASLDELVDTVRAIRSHYKKEIAVEASRRSRAKKKAELEAMKARLAELESTS